MWECGEIAGIGPALEAGECESRGWMQAGAERLTRVDHHHRVARLNGVLAPWGSDHNLANAKNREFGAPRGRPLLCRDSPNS
jgi:hypothetical protein